MNWSHYIYVSVFFKLSKDLKLHLYSFCCPCWKKFCCVVDYLTNFLFWCLYFYQFHWCAECRTDLSNGLLDIWELLVDYVEEGSVYVCSCKIYQLMQSITTGHNHMCHTPYIVSSIEHKTIDDNIMSYCYTSDLGLKDNP